MAYTCPRHLTAGSLLPHRQSPNRAVKSCCHTRCFKCTNACKVPYVNHWTVRLCSATATLVSGGNDFLERLPLGRVDVNTPDSPSLIPHFYWTTVPGYERWREVCYVGVPRGSGAHAVL